MITLGKAKELCKQQVKVFALDKIERRGIVVLETSVLSVTYTYKPADEFFKETDHVRLELVETSDYLDVFETEEEAVAWLLHNKGRIGVAGQQQLKLYRYKYPEIFV